MALLSIIRVCIIPINQEIIFSWFISVVVDQVLLHGYIVIAVPSFLQVFKICLSLKKSFYCTVYCTYSLGGVRV